MLSFSLVRGSILCFELLPEVGFENVFDEDLCHSLATRIRVVIRTAVFVIDCGRGLQGVLADACNLDFGSVPLTC